MGRFRMKAGVGPHYYGGRRYRAGEEINIPEHVAERIADKLVRIGPEPEEETPESGFAIKPVGRGKYDVVSEKGGDPINDEPLNMEDARALAGDRAPVLSSILPEGDFKMRHRGGGRYLLEYEDGSQAYPGLLSKQVCEKVIAGEIDIDDIDDLEGAEK